MSDRDDTIRLSPGEALARLVDGNRRFVAGEPEHPDQTAARRELLGGSQNPYALLLSCADSRVPPEIVFDAGLGDLFVVRSAGHVLDHAILGTLEFGVEQIRTPIVVVLGHTGCGAVKATLRAVESGASGTGTDIDTLVEAITPAVEEAEVEGHLGHDPADGEILDLAIRHNVERTVADVLAAPLVGPAVEEGRVAVVGGVYDLTSGAVELITGTVDLTALQPRQERTA